jgi:hypothetical protein
MPSPPGGYLLEALHWKWPLPARLPILGRLSHASYGAYPLVNGIVARSANGYHPACENEPLAIIKQILPEGSTLIYDTSYASCLFVFSPVYFAGPMVTSQTKCMGHTPRFGVWCPGRPTYKSGQTLPPFKMLQSTGYTMRLPQYGQAPKRHKAPKVPQCVTDSNAAQYGRVRANQPRDKRRSRNDKRWWNWPMCGNARQPGDHADLFSTWSK